MKRFFILLSTLCPLLLLGQSLYRTAAFKGAAVQRAVVSCDTSSQTNAASPDLVEGFQADDGYDLTWSEVGTTANITEGADSSALTTGKAPGQCNKAWKLEVPTDGTETYGIFDYGSTVALTSQSVVLTYNLYVDTAPGEGDTFTLATYRTTSTPSATFTAGIIVTSSGNVYIRCDGDALGPITVDTWYTVKVTLAVDTAACSITVWSGGSQIGTDTWTRSAGDFRYVFFGAPTGLEANDTGTIWFDLITVETP